MEDQEKVLFYGATDTGRQRSNNEDTFGVELSDQSEVLAVVIDGVGGYEGGEVAAAIAKEEIARYLKEYTRGERLTLLKEAVTSANNAIFAQRQRDEQRSNMSCVLTSALIDTERKVIDMVHVGDTRLYQYYRGGLEKLSHDHSPVGYKEDHGELSEKDAMLHPFRNQVSRVVGNKYHEVYDPDFLEAKEFPLLPNSILLLCSDGLTDLVTRSQMTAIIEQDISLEEKVQKLINAANDAGGKDNITVVLVEYQVEKPLVSPKIAEGGNNTEEIENERNQEDSLSESIKEEKKRSPKRGVYALLGCLVLLLGACIVLGVFSKAQYNQMQALERHITVLEDSISNLNKANETEMLADSIQNSVKNTIGKYARAIEANDFDAISQLFAPFIQRYYSARYLSNMDVVKRHKNYDTKFKVTGKHMEIRWNTLKVKQLPNNELYVNFIEDYSIDRIDTTQFSKWVLHYYITLDDEGKIVSIYYDELAKGK